MAIHVLTGLLANNAGLYAESLSYRLTPETAPAG
jgi:hypothetical protein